MASSTVNDTEKSTGVAVPPGTHFRYAVRLNPTNLRCLCLRILALPFFVVLMPGFCCSQNVQSLLSRYFDAVRAGESPALSRAMSSAENAGNLLIFSEAYLRDSSRSVKMRACEIVHTLAIQAPQPTRKQGVEILIRAYSHNDITLKAQLLTCLQQYAQSDFSKAARDSIRVLARQESTYLGRILKLAGFLLLRDLIPEVRARTQPRHSSPVRWAALLALARMGDSTAVAEIRRRVKKIPVNDDVVYQIFPDLVYTRQPKAIAYMVEALQSDGKNCMSANPEKQYPIPCGYRIMEQLAPVIENFPLEIGAHGDLNTEDYSAALIIARRWLTQNKNYTICDDTY